MFTKKMALLRFLFLLGTMTISILGVVASPTEAIAPSRIPHGVLEFQNNKKVVESTLSDKEMEMLAQLVYAEGRGEPFEGQVAIAAVVLNRLDSGKFSDDLNGVIFEKNAFSVVQDGKLPAKTDDTARKAVKEAIRGKDPSMGSLYFFNPETATSSWIWSRQKATHIGNHIFSK
ncbi:cell wall hydrolase [Brevibacillus sp. SYSU BS000544]|uniref:cell wall hydrolase n=1 Tax=Brevibacillus sp. SYSU BS000544 TaxID=3416443 RepID=UPI003CE4EAFB